MAFTATRAALFVAFWVAYVVQLAGCAVNALVLGHMRTAVSVIPAIAFQFARYACCVNVEFVRNISQCSTLYHVVFDGYPHLECNVVVVLRCRNSVTAFPGGRRSGQANILAHSKSIR